MIHRYRVGVCTCLAVLVLAAAGCGPSQATISGKVTRHGKPVTAGTVLFVDAKNHIATGKLDEEGHYVVPRIPMGSFKVTVQTLRPEQLQAMAEQSKDAARLPRRLKNLVPVPEKYADPETSGLTCQVNQPQQEHNIDLP
jgi:hypothetical protein